MAMFNICIRSAQDLKTTPAQTRAGFIEAALVKSNKAKPYIDEARTLRDLASTAKEPKDLLFIEGIQDALLTASGLSDKAMNYFDTSAQLEAKKKLIEEYLSPAGEDFINELVYRYLLVKGDTLGGAMRNFIGTVAEMKLKRKILALFSLLNINYSIYRDINKRKKEWDNKMPYDEAHEKAADIRGFCWCYEGVEKLLFFNTNIPMKSGKSNNVDICLFKGSMSTLPKDIIKDKKAAIMFGELKGGIDPAGADEHWKTANSALDRIRDAFKGYGIKTSFVGAAIEESMANQIYAQLKTGKLSYAANLTVDKQLTNYCEWLVKLK